MRVFLKVKVLKLSRYLNVYSIQIHVHYVYVNITNNYSV